MIIWLIGLSGAGKTTVGEELVRMLRKEGRTALFLDGDILREVWRDELGHSMEARRRNHERISHLCKVLDQDPHLDIVVAALSVFPDLQRWNRENFGHYFEIFLDVPLELAMARDAKGLYAKAQAGHLRNIVGVDIPFPRPPAPDMVVSAAECADPPRTIAGRILMRLRAEAAP